MAELLVIGRVRADPRLASRLALLDGERERVMAREERPSEVDVREVSARGRVDPAGASVSWTIGTEEECECDWAPICDCGRERGDSAPPPPKRLRRGVGSILPMMERRLSLDSGVLYRGSSGSTCSMYGGASPRTSRSPDSRLAVL